MRISVLVHGHFKSTSSVGMEEQTYSFPDGTGMRIRDLPERRYPWCILLRERLGKIECRNFLPFLPPLRVDVLMLKATSILLPRLTY